MLSGVLIAVLAVAVAPALATPRDEPRIDYVGGGVVYGDLGAVTPDATQSARTAFAAHARRLGVDPGAFRFESVRQSLIGTHVRGREERDGVPVADTWAAVHVVRGRVVQVAARSLATLVGRPVDQPVPRTTAITAALRHRAVTSVHRVAAERLLVARGPRLVDTWRVAAVSTAPVAPVTVDVDAGTGRVVAAFDDSSRAEGTAMLFDPNPVVSTRDWTLRQPYDTALPADADVDSPQLSAARVPMQLRDIDPGALLYGRLAGPWVDVTVGALGTSTSFDVPRSDPRFEGLMAYAHIDRFQRYLQSLGFTGKAAVNAEPQDVIATRLEGADASAYYDGTDTMVFGAGGVDDGEDAEVILHEYGHAMQFAQAPGFVASGETGAMGEGFGDFLPSAYFAGERSRGFGELCVAEWDATTYKTGAERCLRRLDSRKVYPTDATGSVHDVGEIWSAFLWRLRGRLPGSPAVRSAAAIRLVVASHELLSPGARFGEGVAALRTAAGSLGHPEWRALIDAEARRTGLPLNP